MHEIDFLAVGEKTKTGDAIATRFTHPITGNQTVVIIDGGFVETGQKLVDFVRDRYNTNTVDLVVCTHPDDDHIKGLFTVIEELDVVRLLIHRPKNYGYTSDAHKSSLVEDLVKLAASKGVTIDDSYFAGTSYFGDALVIAALRWRRRPTSSTPSWIPEKQWCINGLAMTAIKHDPAASQIRTCLRTLGTLPTRNACTRLDLVFALEANRAANRQLLARPLAPNTSSPVLRVGHTHFAVMNSLRSWP